MFESPFSNSGLFHARLIQPEYSVSREACFRLRYGYFVEERGWVHASACDNGMESDEYDETSLHLGVWQNGEVVAYLRALPFDPAIGFMLDREFACLAQDSEYAQFRSEETLELSRLVCRKFPPDGSGPHPLEMLLRRLYHLAREGGYNRFLIVVEKTWLRPFTRRFGLPFQVVGQPHTFPDGTETVLATATLAELEAGMRRHSAVKYDWYQMSSDE